MRHNLLVLLIVLAFAPSIVLSFHHIEHDPGALPGSGQARWLRIFGAFVIAVSFASAAYLWIRFGIPSLFNFASMTPQDWGGFLGWIPVLVLLQKGFLLALGRSTKRQE